MERQVYITEEERAKCQKVVDAFAELYEMEMLWSSVFVTLVAKKYQFPFYNAIRA